MNILQNKIIVVTGATSGLGKILTTKLLHAGAKVGFCGRSEEKMKEMLEELSGLSDESFYSDTFDISDENRIICFINEVKKKLGDIDILINCAGANPARAKGVDIQTADLELMIKVNLTAPFIFMREVSKGMIKKQEGQIININSTVSLYSNEGIGAYTASKAGFDALTKVFRKELRSSNIRVCSIYPGGINTPFRESVREDYLNPEAVADSIISILRMDENIAVDEFVLRPYVEKNFC